MFEFNPFLKVYLATAKQEFFPIRSSHVVKEKYFSCFWPFNKTNVWAKQLEHFSQNFSIEVEVEGEIKDCFRNKF